MNTHRLNYHDILAIEAINARTREKAKANRRADSIAMLGCAVGLAALLLLGLTGGLPS